MVILFRYHRYVTQLELNYEQNNIWYEKCEKEHIKMEPVDWAAK